MFVTLSHMQPAPSCDCRQLSTMVEDVWNSKGPWQRAREIDILELEELCRCLRAARRRLVPEETPTREAALAKAMLETNCKRSSSYARARVRSDTIAIVRARDRERSCELELEGL